MKNTVLSVPTAKWNCLSQPMKKNIFRGIFCLALFAVIFGWKVPIIWKLNTLKLPPGCETVYRTKVVIQDIYWLHIKGEKIIKCEFGYEAAKEYIMAHNAPSKLTNIDIYKYSGMSDIDIYDAEFDDDFWNQPDRDDYVKISYFKMLK